MTLNVWEVWKLEDDTEKRCLLQKKEKGLALIEMSYQGTLIKAPVASSSDFVSLLSKNQSVERIVTIFKPRFTVKGNIKV